jgi:predicted RNA binding protein YcfA (HicA-like mRNA interferase family)
VIGFSTSWQELSIMASKRITFASLQSFLESLGFQSKTIPGSHCYFQHPDSGALIVLRLYQPDEEFALADRALVRRVLDDWGIMERDRFDELLQEHSLAN